MTSDEGLARCYRDGRMSVSLKGNLRKSFYHHPRMQWYCWQLLSAGK